MTFVSHQLLDEAVAQDGVLMFTDFYSATRLGEDVQPALPKHGAWLRTYARQTDCGVG